MKIFQMKGVRKHLKIPPTFIDRTWTNQKVYEEANKQLNENNNKKEVTMKPKIQYFSICFASNKDKEVKIKKLKKANKMCFAIKR